MGTVGKKLSFNFQESVPKMESIPSQEDKEHIDSYRKHQNFKVKKFEFITHVNLWVLNRNTYVDVLWITSNVIRSDKITK